MRFITHENGAQIVERDVFAVPVVVVYEEPPLSRVVGVYRTLVRDSAEQLLHASPDERVPGALLRGWRHVRGEEQ